MTYTVASSCVCPSPLAKMTIVGLHDFVNVSISALLKSFLLIICIDAPESTTNSRSSSLRVDAGKHVFSDGEENVALPCSFSLNTFFANFHAASSAPCSDHSVASWGRSSNFGALELRWWGSPGQKKKRAKDFALEFWWLSHVGLVSACLKLFRKRDFNWVVSWNMQPNCRAFVDRRPTSPRFNSWQVSRSISGLPDRSWLLSRLTTGCHLLLCRPIFFNMATVLLSSFCLCKRALFSKSAATLGLVEQAFWRVPLFTERVGASSFEVILARPSTHSTTGTLSSGTSGFGCFSLILLHERSRRRIRLCQISPLIDIVAETAIVSFSTLPVGFPLKQSPRFFLRAVLSPDSCQRCFFHNFRFWLQNSWFVDSGRYLFSPLSSIFDHQVLLFSGESPYCTIPIRSWIFKTLVLLMWTILPRCHQVGFPSLKKSVSLWIELLNIVISKTNRAAKFPTESLAPVTQKYS